VSDDSAVVFGERVRRWRRVLAGSVVFLLGAVPLAVIAVGVARGVDWYHYKPTALVIRDLRSTNAKLAGQAVGEIARRFNNGDLSATQVSQVAEACLLEQARPVERIAVTPQMVDLLGTFYEGNLLAEDQIDRFFNNLCLLTLGVRPTVIPGRDCPIMVVSENRAPRNGVWAEGKLKEARLDGRALAWRGFSTWLIRGARNSSAVGQRMPVRTTGRHRISVDVDLMIYESGTPRQKVGDPVHTISRTLTGETEVFEVEPPGYIRLTRSPEIDRAVLRGVRVLQTRLRKDTDANVKYVLDCEIEFGARLPIGLAFDVRAEFDKQSLNMGSVYVSPGNRDSLVWYVEHELLGKWPKRIALVLENSKEAALATVDLYEIWGGALLFKELEVSPYQYQVPHSPEIRSTHTPVIPATP